MESDYLRYLELTHQISLFEQEKKILGARILKHLQTETSDRIVVDTGVISVKTRNSWQYPPAVKSRIDIIQKEAQESGEAEQVSSTYLSTSLR